MGKNSTYYQLVAIFQPGNAWFESTFQINANRLQMNKKVLRLNKYGTQSECINDSFLRSYCFCKLIS